MLPFKHYKTTLLTAINSHCIAALHYLPRRLRSKVARSKTPTTVTWSEHLKIWGYVFVVQYRPTTNRSQVSQPASAGQEANMSHHCMTPQEWTWLSCSVWVISANKLSSQEVDQLIGIDCWLQVFKKIFASWSQFPGGEMPLLPPLCGRPYNPPSPTVGAPVWINPVFFRCSGVRCREGYIWRNELSAAK